MELSGELQLIIDVISKPGKHHIPTGLRRNTLIQKLHFHRCTQLFLMRCNEKKVKLPQQLRTALRVAAKRHAYRALAHCDELLLLKEAFDEEGIEFIVLKGAALSKQIYGNAALRQSKDIDLLFKPQDIERVQNVLGNLNYIRKEPKYAPNQVLKIESMKWRCDMDFVHLTRSIKLDVHWHFFPAQKYIAEERLKIWEVLEKVSIAGKDFNTLNKIEAFLYHVVHASSHSYCRLHWLFDLRKLLLILGKKELKEAHNLAKAAYCESAFLEALELADKYFGIEMNISKKRFPSFLAKDTIRVIARVDGLGLPPRRSSLPRDWILSKNSFRFLYYQWMSRIVLRWSRG